MVFVLDAKDLALPFEILGYWQPTKLDKSKVFHFFHQTWGLCYQETAWQYRGWDLTMWTDGLGCRADWSGVGAEDAQAVAPTAGTCNSWSSRERILQWRIKKEQHGKVKWYLKTLVVASAFVKVQLFLYHYHVSIIGFLTNRWLVTILLLFVIWRLVMVGPRVGCVKVQINGIDAWGQAAFCWQVA